MSKRLTPAMIRELSAISSGDGNPSDPFDWQHAPEALWFHAREKVLTALLKRGLISHEQHGFDLTDAGKLALASVQTDATT